MTGPFTRPLAARRIAGLSRYGRIGIVALGAACGDSVNAAIPPSRATDATGPRDTAFVEAGALRIAGFRTLPARRVAWRDSWRAPARLVLDPAWTQALGSIVEGRVTRVLVQPGDVVRRGQVLVTVHSHELLDARNALAQARAGRIESDNSVQLASAAAARSERLYRAKAGALADLERARAARVAAEAGQRRAAAEMARAEEAMHHLRSPGLVPPGTDPDDVLLRAPFDGVVVARDAQPGTVVVPGASLITVSRLGTILLSMRLPEAALAAASVGASVRFTVPAYPGRVFDARVTRVAPMLDSLSRSAEVFAMVDNRSGELRVEMSAAAEVLGPQRDSVLAVPAEAIQDMDGDTVVVTGAPRGAGMLLEAVRVRVGRSASGLAEVLTGIAPRAAVVVDGAAVAKAEILRQRDARGARQGGASE